MKTLAYYLCIIGVIFGNQTAWAANAILDFNFNQVGSSAASNAGSAFGTFNLYNGTVSTSTPDSTLMGISGVSGYALNGHAGFSTAPTASTANATGVYLSGTGVQKSSSDNSAIDLTNFTISFWYQGAILDADNQRIFAATGASGATPITLIVGGSGLVILYVNSTSTNSMTSGIKLTAADLYTSTTWKYVAVSFSSAGNGTYSQATFYTGDTNATLTKVGTYNCNTGIVDPVGITGFTVGNLATNNRAFTGNIDNFQLYDDALSQSEVQTLLTAQAIPEPSVVSLWIVGMGALWLGRKKLAEKMGLAA